MVSSVCGWLDGSEVEFLLGLDAMNDPLMTNHTTKGTGDTGALAADVRLIVNFTPVPARRAAVVNVIQRADGRAVNESHNFRGPVCALELESDFLGGVVLRPNSLRRFIWHILP